MRPLLILLASALFATPAVAQTTPAAPVQMPRALTDPAMADRLANAMQATSQAFLDLPVGGIEAAVEGRTPTPAESRRTVRDLGRRDDPNFDRDFQRQIAQAKPMIRQSQKALADALPAMMDGLRRAGEALDRATANLPDPTYPKR